MKTVIVASENPVKVAVAKSTFGAYFPKEDFTVVPVKSLSGVRDQPIGEEETLRGAHNRLNFVRYAYPSADYWIAMEGGAIEAEPHMLECAFIVTLDRAGNEGLGRTATFPAPTVIRNAIRNGEETGPAVDRIFGTTNIKHGLGMIGLLTDGHIDRAELYRHAALIAIAQMVHHDLFS